MPKKTIDSEYSEELSLFEYGQEGESDLEIDYLGSITETVLWSTDWTLETIVSSLNRKSFDLDPTFQRRNAWNVIQKSRLIESLIFGLPIPQIVLAESKDKKGSFIVVDGKQRLLTISEFFDEKDGLSLSGLNNKQLNGLNCTALKEKFPDFFNSLLVYSIRSVIIKNWPTENFLYTIFYRLNTGSVQLSPQELRKALKPGPFISYVDNFVLKSKSIKILINKKEPDPRMRDLDLALRFIGFKTRADEYSGNYKKFIDDICDRYNKDWENSKATLYGLLLEMDNLIDTCFKIFGKEKVFRKASKLKKETRMNRAIFDVVMYYFSQIDHTYLIDHKKEILYMMDRLYADLTFSASISLATNGQWETSQRYTLFGEEFNRTFDQKVAIPTFKNA